jgi:hypothetical protein
MKDIIQAFVLEDIESIILDYLDFQSLSALEMSCVGWSKRTKVVWKRLYQRMFMDIQYCNTSSSGSSSNCDEEENIWKELFRVHWLVKSKYAGCIGSSDVKTYCDHIANYTYTRKQLVLENSIRVYVTISDTQHHNCGKLLKIDRSFDVFLFSGLYPVSANIEGSELLRCISLDGNKQCINSNNRFKTVSERMDLELSYIETDSYSTRRYLNYKVHNTCDTTLSKKLVFGTSEVNRKYNHALISQLYNMLVQPDRLYNDGTSTTTTNGEEEMKFINQIILQVCDK